MTENINENTTGPDDDVEGHRVRHAPVDERVRPGLVEDDDVEGHVQPPRGDDTDHLHS